MSAKREIDKQLIEAKQREVRPWVAVPLCNPWEYSQSKSSYPADPKHLDYRDPKGFFKTRLHRAVAADDLELVRTLVRQGANPWVADNVGKSPLDLAINGCASQEIADYLRQEMKRIRRECKRYEEETGRKLGRRSQRRLGR